jgi:hypothetical protein
MAKPKRKPTLRRKLPLMIEVSGSAIHAGRIPIPELLVICEHAQSAVNRQAEQLEGVLQTLRPGPRIGKVRQECTLELVSIGKGCTVIGLDQAKGQPNLPSLGGLGADAIARVGETIQAIARKRANGVDAGVLDSLNKMCDLLDNGVKRIRWIVPAQAGKKKIEATINRTVRDRIREKVRPPTSRQDSIDGVLEEADFKPLNQGCRIRPPFGQAIDCTFTPEFADKVYENLRHTARIKGTAKVNAQSGRVESIAITDVSPLEPLSVNSGGFISGWTLDQLAQMQAVEPLDDVRALAGGLPDDEDLDAVLADIYQHRM